MRKRGAVGQSFSHPGNGPPPGAYLLVHNPTLMQLKEAKVLVTGGNSGIGAAIARHLAAAGARVVVAGRNADTLGAVAETDGITALRADVSREEEVVRLVSEAHAAMGGLNVLINNAGYGYGAPLLQLEAAPFRDVFAVNVLGAALCAREAARIFVEQRYGNIVNVASTAALKGSPNASPYVATKFALRGMTESWRAELRPYNVRVMLVNPSEVMTPFAARMERPDGPQKKHYSDQERATKLRADEIAHTVVSMLAMDDRGFITEATVFATNPQS